MKLEFLNERFGNDSNISILIDRKIVVNMQEGCIQKLFKIHKSILEIDTIVMTNLNKGNYMDVGSFLLARKLHDCIEKEASKEITVICPKGAKELITKISNRIPEIIEDIEKEKNIHFVYFEKNISDQNIDTFCFELKKLLF